MQNLPQLPSLKELPSLGTLLNKPIWRSKRFVSTLFGLVVMVAVGLFPDLEPFEDTILRYGENTVLALIAGFTVTDLIGFWILSLKEDAAQTPTSKDDVLVAGGEVLANEAGIEAKPWPNFDDEDVVNAKTRSKG